MHVRGDNPQPTDSIFNQQKRCWNVRQRRRRRQSARVGLGVWISKPGPIWIPIWKDASKSPLHLTLRGYRSGHRVYCTPQLAHIVPCYTSIGHLAADAPSRDDADADQGQYRSARCWTRTSVSRATGLCVISVTCGRASACEKESWTCCREGKDQPWRQIKADSHCELSIRCSWLFTYSIHGTLYCIIIQYNV